MDNNEKLNRIDFIIDSEDEDWLIALDDEDDFNYFSGQLEMMVDGKPLTKDDKGEFIWGENYIIQFASDCIGELPNIIQGNKVEIKHGDAPRMLVCEREENNINLNVYDEGNEYMMHEPALKMNIHTFSEQLYMACKRLKKLISVNPNCHDFELYDEFVENMIKAKHFAMEHDIKIEDRDKKKLNNSPERDFF